jgi:CheY-like chemotaxis protein
MAKALCLQAFTEAVLYSLTPGAPVPDIRRALKNAGRNGLCVSANPLILCIDDEALGLQIRKVVLERAGYRVITALDGAAGLSLFGEHSVDAVILDYYMPGMNGGEVAVEMRRAKKNVPILLLSAYVDLPPEVVELVDFILLKGDGPGMLMEKIQEMLASHEAIRGAASESG